MKSIWTVKDGSYLSDRKPRRRIRVGTKWVLPKPKGQMARVDWDAFEAEHLGDFIVLPIEHDLYGFGRILSVASMGFYDLISPAIPPLEELETRRFLFVVPAEGWPIRSGRWKVIGNRPLPDALRTPIAYYLNPPGTDFVEIIEGNKIRPYAGEDLTKMERFVGLAPWSVEERIRSHFAGRPDFETELDRIPVELAKRRYREYWERHGKTT
jgi:hypothetical protein